MSSTFLSVGSWTLNPKHVVFIRKTADEKSWEVTGFQGLMNVSKLLLDDLSIENFRKALPAGFVEVQPVREKFPVLINLENIAGIERQPIRSAPTGSFGQLPASSPYFESNLGTGPMMISARLDGDGKIFKIYTLDAGKRSNVLTLELMDDPIEPLASSAVNCYLEARPGALSHIQSERLSK